MFSFSFSAVAAAAALFSLGSYAQAPPASTFSKILKSPLNPDITVSYKQPDAGTCETAYSTQQQYTGYVNLPPFTLAPVQQNYSINTFFWFVEARQLPEAAPLTIWLNGGPGSSSMIGFFNENGPCQVVQMNDGSYGTQARLWGWDRSSNMLFIDQPNLVGFSYDSLTNATYDFLTEEAFSPPVTPRANRPPFMFENGTFGSANTNSDFVATANTTEIAARATWHFLQTWLAAFPQYNPAVRPNATTVEPPSDPVGVNLFSESYGGKYAPAFASFFEEQNQARNNGTLAAASTLEIRLDVVGIINGLVDDAIQDYYYPVFAYNNTYGIQVISQTEELNALSAYTTPNGCLSKIQRCRNAIAARDPAGFGDDDTANVLCSSAQASCNALLAPYYVRGYNVYDVRIKSPSPDPPAAYQEYLNQPSVLQSIGAQVNYTESSRYVQGGFLDTGDTIRGGGIDDLAQLLRMGIRVAFIYGDADFICNWYGGQAVSLAVAQKLSDFPSPSSSYSTAFPAAGYAEIVTNSSYVGGSVRQFGNLSFSRIYDAGHLVPYYQPETAYTVFTRIIRGNDVATGKVTDLKSYGSSGPANSTKTNKTPANPPAPTCWVRSWNSSCSDDETRAMLKGDGVVKNGIFYYAESDAELPKSSVTAGLPGKPMGTSQVGMEAGSSSIPLTGVYTATATPSPGAAVDLRPLFTLDPSVWPIVSVLAGFVSGLLWI